MNGTNDLTPHLLESYRRIKERYKIIRNFPLRIRLSRLEDLRKVMFTRRKQGCSFLRLDEEEMALLWGQMQMYIAGGSLSIAGVHSIPSGIFAALRYNYILGVDKISPGGFRKASDIITQILFDKAIKDFCINPGETTVLLPWRAGLAFGSVAVRCGFCDFYHLGSKRNEDTLEIETWYEEPSPQMARGCFGKIVLADPMVASGNTTVDSLEHLIRWGFKPENIIVVCVIAAPEGVDHVLHNFPGVRILTGALDEGIDELGYIFPGLGDFGDQYCDGIVSANIKDWWVVSGILTKTAFEALCSRMGV